MKRTTPTAIVPQQVTVAAPMALVFDMIRTIDYECRPGSGRSVSRISSSAERAVAAFSSTHTNVPASADQGQTQAHIVKEVLAYPPDRVVYRHLSGPLLGATEELHVEQNGGEHAGMPVPSTGGFPATGTRISLHVELQRAQDQAQAATWRAQKAALEQRAHEHLLDLKAAAEARARPIENTDSPRTMLVDVPIMTSEQELLDAVDAQEDAEWGHAGHGRGVARIAVSLAEAMVLPKHQIEDLKRAALLHDLGKIALDSILWGERRTLTPEQRVMMQAHPRLGHDLAERAGLPEYVLSSILYHHERWDGQGYPEHLQGEAIPLRARILGVAENVDSMMRASYRRDTLSLDEVIAMLEAGAGHYWDPILARKAARIMRKR